MVPARVEQLSKTTLTASERRALPVSVINDGRRSVVVSRVGDLEWDLRPLFDQSNITASRKTLKWPRKVSADLVFDAQWVVFLWMTVGRPGLKPAGASTAASLLNSSVRPFLRWLNKVQVHSFDQLRPIHVTQYVQQCKERRIDPGGVYSALKIIELLWVFRDEMEFPIAFYPWGKLNISAVSGLMRPGRGRERSAKTQVIPQDVQDSLLAHCESVVANAPAVFRLRDTGEIGPQESPLIAIRDACLYLIAISSGMRCEEAVGLEVGACSSEYRNGVRFNWLESIEHKTGKGRVVYLVPDMTVGVFKVLEEYARPLQERLDAHIRSIDKKGRAKDKEDLLRRKQLVADRNRLFLTSRGPKKDNVTCLAHAGCNLALQRIALTAGTDWKLKSHQPRRTYARMFAESQLGRRSLLFLKWQFKHSSMEMTELYAANPNQDGALFEEILDEIAVFKSELLDGWLSEGELSGGAGRKIVEIRAIPIRSRAELVQTTSQQVHIRATGHAWCLSQLRGCGGAGIYEAGRCVDCNSGVIDEFFEDVWTGIYEQQRELLEIPDIGQGAIERAERDLKQAETVLKELGLVVPE